MKTMATASKPSASRAPRARARTASRSGAVSTVPSASTRSSTSIDLGVELLGLDDVARRRCRAAPGSRSRSASRKPARRDEQRALALALEQRVGRDGRAHLDVADASGGNRLAGAEAEEIADRLHRGVVVGRGSPTAACAHAAAPRGSRAITSVNVPPRSIQKSQRRRFRASPPRFVITLASLAAALLWHAAAAGSIFSARGAWRARRWKWCGSAKRA